MFIKTMIVGQDRRDRGIRRLYIPRAAALILHTIMTLAKVAHREAMVTFVIVQVEGLKGSEITGSVPIIAVLVMGTGGDSDIDVVESKNR